MEIQLNTIESIYIKIAESCKQKRRSLTWTQMELAERAGLSLRTIKKIENHEIVNLQSLMKIYMTFGELPRWNSLMIETIPSPKEQFLKEHQGGN